MLRKINLFFILIILIGLSSCVSKKKFTSMEEGYKQNLALANKQLGECGESLNQYMDRVAMLKGDLENANTKLEFREEQISDLKAQLSSRHEV